MSGEIQGKEELAVFQKENELKLYAEVLSWREPKLERRTIRTHIR